MKTEAMIEAILFACGDPVSVKRLCALTGMEETDVRAAAAELGDSLSFEERGIRLVRLEDSYQLVSAPEYRETVRRALETRRPPKLTPAAVEVLAIVAYYQPVTRTYIEQVRGVDSSYTVGALAERGLIEPCGKLDVPGRPTLFKTTDAFLRAFGLSGLDELPDTGETEETGEQLDIEKAIEQLRAEETK